MTHIEINPCYKEEILLWNENKSYLVVFKGKRSKLVTPSLGVFEQQDGVGRGEERVMDSILYAFIPSHPFLISFTGIFLDWLSQDSEFFTTMGF